MVARFLSFLGTNQYFLGFSSLCGAIGFVLTIIVTAKTSKISKILRACLKSFDKQEGKADNKGKQGGDDGECVNIQAISAGKSMKRYERI